MVSPADKKQITSVRQSYGNLVEKMNGNEVSGEVLGKLAALIDCFMQRNFPGASAIQTVSSLFSYFLFYAHYCRIWRILPGVYTRSG